MATPRACSPRARSPRSCTRTWPFGCWPQTTSPSTPRRRTKLRPMSPNSIFPQSWLCASSGWRPSKPPSSAWRRVSARRTHGAGASLKAKMRGPAFKRAFGVPEPKAQDNFTDPDSRIMKTSAGFEQCFNAQTAVDAGAQIIVAAELSNCAADSALLPTMLDAVKSNTGQVPEVLLADAGYRSEAVLAQLSGKQVEVIVALGREGKKQSEIDAHKHPHTAAMAAKLKTQPGQDKYRRRKAIVEPPNAWIKQVLRFRQFSFKGIDKVRCEFKLVCAALNLRRMAAMGV